VVGRVRVHLPWDARVSAADDGVEAGGTGMRYGAYGGGGRRAAARGWGGGGAKLREEARRTAEDDARVRKRRLWAMIEHWGWRFLIEDRTTVEGVYRNACVLTKQAPIARVSTEGGARFAYASSDAVAVAAAILELRLHLPVDSTADGYARIEQAMRAQQPLPKAHEEEPPEPEFPCPSCGAMAYTGKEARMHCSRAFRKYARAR
jgi:hypothetical protein